MILLINLSKIGFKLRRNNIDQDLISPNTQFKVSPPPNQDMILKTQSLRLKQNLKIECTLSPPLSDAWPPCRRPPLRLAGRPPPLVRQQVAAAPLEKGGERGVGREIEIESVET